MVRHLFLYGSCVWENCLQGEGWGGSTNDFHISLVSRGLAAAVAAESLTVTRSSLPTQKAWHRGWCALAEQNQYPDWALPSFDSSQQEKPWEYKAALCSKCLAGYLKHPVPNNCYKKQTSELHR